MPKISEPWTRSALLWLGTNLLGSCSWALFLIVKHGEVWGSLLVSITSGLMALLFSLPAIPVAFAIFNKILPPPHQPNRLLLVFQAVTGICVVPVAAAGVFFGKPELLQGALLIAIAYYSTALILTGLIYQPWIFKRDAQG